jgi:hypothetical protein
VRKRQRFDASTSTLDLESRIRAQAGLVSAELRTLHAEVRDLAKSAQNHRWRRWIVGGAMLVSWSFFLIFFFLMLSLTDNRASFIPAVRRFWRRGSDEESLQSSNDTEYAFRRSKTLLSRINETVFGRGGLASFSFLVFAVLYVFQNEVSLRVAKTIQKRIKKLCTRIENGETDVAEQDMKILEGWRWRILLW